MFFRKENATGPVKEAGKIVELFVRCSNTIVDGFQVPSGIRLEMVGQ